jgi:hypothetical protein
MARSASAGSAFREALDLLKHEVARLDGQKADRRWVAVFVWRGHLTSGALSLVAA